MKKIWPTNNGIAFGSPFGEVIEIPEDALAELGFFRKVHDGSRDIPGAPHCDTCGFSMALTTDFSGQPLWMCETTLCPMREHLADCPLWL